MAKLSDRLFIGVGGHIVAIDATSGTELWRTKLKTSGFASVAVVENRLYGGAGGELFCLDSATGTVLWRNKLKGLGIGLVAFPGSSDALGASLAEKQRQAAAAG